MGRLVEAANASPKKKGSRTRVRIAYYFLMWLFLAAILLQVLLIGLGLLGGSANYLEAHAGLGWTLGHMFAPIVLIVGFFARLGPKLLVINVLMLVLVAILPILATLREDAPVIAGLHPLAAVTLFALVFYTIGKVRTMIPAPIGSAPVQPQTPTPALTSKGTVTTTAPSRASRQAPAGPR